MTAAPSSPAYFHSLSWPQRLWRDLQPAPGRLNATLRIVLTTAISLVLMMVLQLPFASLGLYYIFLVARENPATSVRSSVMALLTLVLGVASVLAVVVLTDNDPMARLLSVAAASFVAGMLMVASTLPPLAAIWGFVYCTLIALWERPAPPDALVKACLYLLATVGLAALVSSAVEYVFANQHPADRLAQQLGLRYKTIERVFTLFADGAPSTALAEAITGLNRVAGTGQRPMQDLYSLAVARGDDTRRLPAGTREQITMLAELLDVAAAFASQHTAGVEPELRSRCAEIARRCRERSVGEVAPAGNSDAPALDRVEAVLESIILMPAQSASDSDKPRAAAPVRKPPFLVPGALTNKDSVAFALKMTLCVMVCYIFYFAVAWPGISTSVTTVFLTALGNSGAMNQKLANRLLGSAIGGGLAIVASVFLFPHMDTITSLVLLISAVAFLAAWWACGRHFGYSGLQIAFSFYLVAFEGFRAPTDLTPPRDRLIGILVALVVMWIVFDELWPVRTVTAMRRALASVLSGEARFLRLFEGDAGDRTRMHQVEALRDQLARTIAGLRTMNDNVAYEIGPHREVDTRDSQAILEAALSAVPLFWNQMAVLRQDERERHLLTRPELIEMRRRLASQLDAMAGAVLRKTPFTQLQPADLADAALFAEPGTREYVTGTTARLEELQSRVAGLIAADGARH